MTLQQIEYALELSKQLSFKKAASKLSITQPALSIQIQRLEQEIGLVLFDRATNPISVTDDGNQFLIRAQELSISASNLKKFTAELGTELSGAFNVGVIPTLAPFLVPLFCDHLQDQNPKLHIDYHEKTTANVIAGVRNGEFEAGIIATPVDVFGIDSHPVFYERFFFYSSSKADLSHLDLDHIDYNNLWILNEGNCFRDQINNFCDASQLRKDRKFNYHSNSIDALIRIVDMRGGITILPELTTLSLSPEQEENIAPIEQKAREIGIITRKSSGKARLAEALAASISSNIPASMLKSDELEVVDPEIKMD